MSGSSTEKLSYTLRHDLFQGGMIESLIFGLYTALILFTTHKIMSKHGLKVFRQPLVVVMLVMYITSIFHFGRHWNWLRGAFVDHGGSVESTLEAIGTYTVAESVIASISRGSLMFLGDFVIIWRCWKLYAHSWGVVLVPAVLATVELAIVIARVVYQIRDRFSVIGSDVPRVLNAVHISLTLAATVIATLLIVYRIVRMGGFQRYRDIIAIIVESSALYAVTLVVYMIFPFHPTLWDIIPSAVLVLMPGILSTLIIARVSLGRAIEHTCGEKATEAGGHQSHHQISTLRFRATTTGIRDEEISSGGDMDETHDTQILSDGLEKKSSREQVSEV